MNYMPPFNAKLQSLTITDLVLRIVQNDDREALEEIMSRSLFSSIKKNGLSLVEYIESLRIWPSRRNCGSVSAHETVDKAYDNTLDKFSNMPAPSGHTDPPPQTARRNMKRKGADCRLYYRAYLSYVRKQFEKRPPEGPIDEERRAALYLQRFVYWHFFLSLRDVDRNANPFWSRYNWNLGGKKVSVWLPVYLRGQERRRWLEKHIEEPDPSRPRERQRIQTIINTKLKSLSFIPFDDAVTQQTKRDPFASGPSTESEFFRETLALTIADEKCDRICEQRRSIQKLGRDNLKRMILKIFEDMDAGDLQDHQVAKEFGLSKATYSRFAGSRWDQTAAVIPDLWRNTAGVLAADPDFREAARSAGVWHQVEIIVKNGGAQ